MANTPSLSGGVVRSGARTWLRLGGWRWCWPPLCTRRRVASWLVFAAVFFVPDISLVCHLAGPCRGAAIYNAAHSYIGPLTLVATLMLSGGTVPTLALV